ncbi:MAG: glucose-1-phosphate adenylyltransferase [Chloroflexi bacterium]|nr:glucose-1-phosphate adenylyltransferase [Chloroflexota bacterium]
MAKGKVLAVILAGGQGNRLGILSDKRAKPAVPFAGKYRIIDFTLSNCFNSGISDVAVLTQYRPRSLHDHIRVGRAWDMDRVQGGIHLLQPYLGRHDEDWYKGTADAVYQNLNFVEDHRGNVILILSGDHVYRMNYDDMVRFHHEKGADLTVAVMEVPWDEASRYGILQLDDTGKVMVFDEKPKSPKSNLVSMGVYVFNKDKLKTRIVEDASRITAHDFGRDVVPLMVKQDKVYGFRFQGYWRDVGTIKSYWEANMDMLAPVAELDLYDREMPVRSRPEYHPPVRTGSRARIVNSLVCDGCIVHGTVEHSILSPGVVVAEGAVIRDSIVLNDASIGREAIIDKAILDKNVHVGDGAHIGYGDDYTPNRRYPQCLTVGITVIGKSAVIPPGVQIGRNCIIGSNVVPHDFVCSTVVSGLIVQK